MPRQRSPDPAADCVELVLEDGSIYSGTLLGSPRSVAGEVVFNTGMLGYPESLTDPSYRGQILVLTYPLIGNYGVPPDGAPAGGAVAGGPAAAAERHRSAEDPLGEAGGADGLSPDGVQHARSYAHGGRGADPVSSSFESERVHVRALIVSEYSEFYSHWTAEKSLAEWLFEQNVPGVSGIDTRALTKRIRREGTMLGKIVLRGEDVDLEDPNRRNLVAEVSVSEPVEYIGGASRIALIDCGVKNSIISALTRRGLTVIRCPWDYDFLDLKPHGVVISNGPGDPRMVEETIENVRRALSLSLPILGVCLGSQILGLAAGAATYKLKYGHRSQNQPCVETGTKRCYITSQNHGYAVDAETLPQDWREWFYNNNDGSNEGIKHISRPFFGAQFHPEASPGPDDTEFLFDLFLRALR